jgi:hypothetical protein
LIDLSALAAGIAQAISTEMGGPYHPGAVLDGGTPVMAGGSIQTPGTPTERACMVQVDQASEAMRRSEGFADGDVRFLVLARTLDGALDTDAKVRVDAGPHTGTWMVSGINRDPVGIYWEGRGRRA